MQDLLDDTIAEKYTVIDKLGSGGFATVYKALQKSLDRPVVIKVFDAQLAASAEIQARIRREAKATSHINHPGVVKIFDHGFLSDGRPYLVLEYIEGTTLADRLANHGTLSTDELYSTFTQIVAALAAAHGANIIHRDITPKNIIVTESSESPALLTVKLIDFGLVRPSGDWAHQTTDLTRIGYTVGSPMYMSPEQCTGKPVDERSDIYSLGCCMYETIAGKPFAQGTNAIQCMQCHLYKQPELPELSNESSNSALARKIRSITMRCLEKHATRRYQSCADLLADLTGAHEVYWESSPDTHTRTIERSSSDREAQVQSKNLSPLANWRKSKLLAVSVVALCGALVFELTAELWHMANHFIALQSQKEEQIKDAALQRKIDKIPRISLDDAAKAPIVDAPTSYLMGVSKQTGRPEIILLNGKKTHHIQYAPSHSSLMCATRAGDLLISFRSILQLWHDGKVSKTINLNQVLGRNHDFSSADTRVSCLRTNGAGNPIVGTVNEAQLSVWLLPSDIPFSCKKEFSSSSIDFYTTCDKFAFDSKHNLIISVDHKNYLWWHLYKGEMALVLCATNQPKSWDLDADDNIVFIAGNGAIGRYRNGIIEQFTCPTDFVAEAISIPR